MIWEMQFVQLGITALDEEENDRSQNGQCVSTVWTPHRLNAKRNSETKSFIKNNLDVSMCRTKRTSFCLAVTNSFRDWNVWEKVKTFWVQKVAPLVVKREQPFEFVYVYTQYTVRNSWYTPSKILQCCSAWENPLYRLLEKSNEIDRLLSCLDLLIDGYLKLSDR